MGKASEGTRFSSLQAAAGARRGNYRGAGQARERKLRKSKDKHEWTLKAVVVDEEIALNKLRLKRRKPTATRSCWLLRRPEAAIEGGERRRKESASRERDVKEEEKKATTSISRDDEATGPRDKQRR